MKKINSIGYGHKIIEVAGLFLVVIPIFCYFFYSIFYLFLIKILMYMSLVIGLIIFVFLIGLLSVEFYQDRNIGRRYFFIKKTKLLLDSGYYECQSCGNRKVNEKDKNCDICGIKFIMEL